MKKNKNRITIENLVAMVKRGFDQTATKDDLKELATKVELHDLETELHDLKDITQEIAGELNAAHTDVRYIRSTTDALVHSDIAQEAAIEDLISRVHRIEKKVGFA